MSSKLSQETINQIMTFLFSLQISNKLYHLTTTSFARHKAADAFDDVLLSHIDKFAEVFIGRYNVRPSFTSLTSMSTSSINLITYTDNTIISLYMDARRYLEKYETMFKDSELLNIRDELIADINKTLYLFNLQ
jgi:hypothetical protein